jgi:Bacterial regulatory proteins, luxR family
MIADLDTLLTALYVELTDRIMSPATVKTHVSRIMSKLAAHDRTQLVVLAYETGLVRPGWL